MPATAYRVPIGPLGYSRRSILILNDPALFRSVLTDPLDVYPKNDPHDGRPRTPRGRFPLSPPAPFGVASAP